MPLPAATPTSRPAANADDSASSDQADQSGQADQGAGADASSTVDGETSSDAPVEGEGDVVPDEGVATPEPAPEQGGEDQGAPEPAPEPEAPVEEPAPEPEVSVTEQPAAEPEQPAAEETEPAVEDAAVETAPIEEPAVASEAAYVAEDEGVDLLGLLAPTEAIADDQDVMTNAEALELGQFTAAQAAGTTDVGTHYYTVSENHPDGAKQNADGTYTFQGITYDPTTYTVTVEVTDEGNGKISAVVTDVTRNSDGTNVGTGNGAISFTNHYAVSEPGTVEIEGVTKVLKGQDMSSDKQFSFLVVDGAGNTVTTGETQQAALAGEQAQVVFAPFIVEDEGTYEYWIVENNGGQTHSGIAYDDARFHVVVTATDNGMGGLDVAVSFDEGVTPAVRERVLHGLRRHGNDRVHQDHHGQERRGG